MSLVSHTWVSDDAMHQEEIQLRFYEGARKIFERDNLVRLLKITVGNVT